MNKDNKVPYEIFKDLLKKAQENQSNKDYLDTAMEYVLEKDPYMYNDALEYADKLKENDYFTNDEIKRFLLK
jgi:hypothetical protein